MRRRQPIQLHLDNTRWGGVRPGAGRPKVPGSGVSHLSRPVLAARHPVHVTLRMARHVWNLRTRRCFSRIEAALRAGKDAFGARITHYAVLGNHIQLIVEAQDKRSLARVMQGLCVRLARTLNKVMRRKGRVFADRYHARILRTPREVRLALAYVLCNARRHAAQFGERHGRGWLDPFSSARFFDGWRRRAPLCAGAPTWMAGGTAEPRTWLLRIGWRKGGLLDPDMVPGWR